MPAIFAPSLFLPASVQGNNALPTGCLTDAAFFLYRAALNDLTLACRSSNHRGACGSHEQSQRFISAALNTLAHLPLYLHLTKLVSTVEEIRPPARAQQQKYLEARAKPYALGCFEMDDGTLRVAIDEEPRISKYERGREGFDY